MFVAVLPFTTALLSEYVRSDVPERRLAALLYSGVLAVAGRLCTILRNTFIDGYRRRAAILMDFEGGGRQAALHEVGETDPEGAFFSRIMDGKVLEAIDALPEESREVLVLSDVENLSYAEIAKVVGAPIGTVKSRLFRARHHLKESLYEHAVAMGYIRPRPAAATPA
jgi:DNA-directed RNA polymerase specialized sigma24 family protein